MRAQEARNRFREFLKGQPPFSTTFFGTSQKRPGRVEELHHR